MESHEHFTIQMSESSHPSTMYASPAAPGGDITIQPLLSQGPHPKGTIIVKTVDPQTGFGSSQKLKSLLPKGFITNISKHKSSLALSNDSSLVDNAIPDGAFLASQLSQPETSLSMASQVTVDDISHFDVSNIEETLEYDDSSVTTLPKVEVKETNLFNPFIPSNMLKEQPHCNNYSDPPVKDIYESDTSMNNLPSSKAKNTEQSDIIKKTMVEAFVKMVVCRKVTVKTLDAETGKVYKTDVRTEEEEPVILGVDRVETTEDLTNSTSLSDSKVQSSSGLLTTKLNSSIDGLKFLSAVSESRPKIGKKFIKDKLFSTLKAKQGSTVKSEFEEASTFKNPKDLADHSFSKPKPDKGGNDYEWNEELNDDSEDFVPKTYQHRYKSPKKSSKKPFLSGSDNHAMDFKKKRGRKRKWDNAIGLSSNLKICPFCSKQFKSIKACGKHIKKGNCVVAICCFICSLPLKNAEELEKHLSTHRSESKNKHFECRDCKRVYRTKAGYVKHFQNGTCQKRDDIEYEDGSSGDFSCDLCSSKFTTEDYLKLHKYKVHENPKDRHICSDCGKQFYSYQGFQKHRTTRSCTEKLKCHICGKSYAKKARESFKIHMQHHRSEATGLTYNCEDCGRAYMTQMSLNKHKLSHTGVKPYKCEICGKEFSMRYMVKDHARMHTGERPYNCSLCGTAFSNKGHLGRHLRSHENGTLLKRGRPKKIRDPEEQLPQEATLKMINLGDLQGLDSQSFQIVDSQAYDGQGNGTPMIIQADNNTIIIADGWPDSLGVPNAVCLDGTTSHEIIDVTKI